MHRVLWCFAAAVLALVSCGRSHAAPTPTIEYRTPAPLGTMVHTLKDVPNPPPCSCGLDSAAQIANSTRKIGKPPTATPTETPVPIATPAPETVTSQSVASPTIFVASGKWSGATYDGRCGDYSDAVTRWWPVVTQYPWDACTVLYIINRESGGQNVYNYEGSGACGLLQLLPCQYPDDGAANIAAGYAKYQAALATWGDGWQPWDVG